MNSESRSNNGRPQQDEIPTTDKLALVKRVSASSHLNRSPRLTKLLEYLTESSLNSPDAVIHEQEIGASVFGRQADYDTGQDNIVRVQVGQLRRKIDKYFTTDGIDEPLVLEIPKGSYVPIFHPKISAESESLEDLSPSTHDRSRVRTISIDQRLAGASVIVVFVMIGVCLWLFVQNRRLVHGLQGQLKEYPAVNSLWSRLFINDQPTDIVLADSVLSLFQDRLGRQVTFQEYLKRDYESKLLEPFPDKERDDLNNIMIRRYTSFGDVNLLIRILRLRNIDERLATIILARDYQVRGLKTHNVVLFGSKRSNPWVEIFEEQTNFHFDYTEQNRHPSIRNQTPQSGEQDLYQWPGEGKGYAIVTFLPNLDRTGSILIIQGEDMVSTEAAGEFVTDEASFSKFHAILARQSPHPAGRLPWFEVLLATRKVGSAARSVEIIAFRILPL